MAIWRPESSQIRMSFGTADQYVTVSEDDSALGADWPTRASLTVDQTGVHQQHQRAASATAKP
jgi:hypothetical protein